MSQVPPIQPMYQTPPSPKPQGMAIASMVLGIISVVLFCVPYVSVPCAIVAIILGIIAKGKANTGEGGGGTMAKTGLILGIVNIVLVVLMFILFAIGIKVFAPKLQQLQQRQLQQMQGMQNPQTGVTPTLPATPTLPEAPKPDQNGNPLAKP